MSRSNSINISGQEDRKIQTDSLPKGEASSRAIKLATERPCSVKRKRLRLGREGERRHGEAKSVRMRPGAAETRNRLTATFVAFWS
jgi:hypothetical protein